jgi:glycosyltransferase involved in cell wall biosynthesis
MFQEKNKVLFGITKSNWGGAQKYVFDIVSSIKGEYNVSVMLGGNGLLKDKIERLGIEIEKLNIERNISVFKDAEELFRIFKIIREKNPNILHLNSSKMGILGALSGRLCNLFFGHNTKIIFTAHGWAFNEDRGEISQIIIKIIYWLTILMCHKTICVSYAIKRQVENWPFIKNKLEVIHNGIGESDFLNQISARSFLDPQKKYTDRIWLGTVSELHPIKRLENMINALSEVKHDFIFFICGGGERKEYLQNLINSLGMQGKIILYGYLENATRYMKAFDIFTLTSKSEALGYVILEAGKAELPVIASAVGGIPEIIENGKSGTLVEAENIKEIRDAIEHLINTPKESLILAKNLKKKIDADFSLEEMIRNTVDVYSSL